MSQKIKRLIDDLEEDPFRVTTPFDEHLEAAAAALYKSASDRESASILGDWLGKYQPCLFGRIAARLGGLSYCFLSEADLKNSDEHVRTKVQNARREWRRKAFNGEASGFVILAVSERLARALPNETAKSLAKRLCHLYLGRDDLDEILLEDLFLRVPGKEGALIHWRAGVNYFSSHGDHRWWQDHRIPAGLGFSINSVGHLVKSFELARSSEEMWKRLGLLEEEWPDFKVSSLGGALTMAMQTIGGAAETISGKATRLLPINRSEGNPRNLECPIALPKSLQDKDFCEYFGYYHTDVTIPSEYFRPDVERPVDIAGHTLDFTYLFNDDTENPAYDEMGRGVRVRADQRTVERIMKAQAQKVRRMRGAEGLISDFPSLREALVEEQEI